MIDIIAGILESTRGIIPFALTIAFIISFSFLIIYFATNFGYIRKKVSGKRQFWILLILILLLGLVLRIATPIFYPTYLDELSNIEVSKNIVRYGQPLLCEYGGPGEISCQKSFVSVTHNYIISLFFILFGISTHSAYLATLIISLLAIIMVTVSAYLLFRNGKIALWAGFFTSIFPFNILQSNTLEKDTTFILLIFLTIFAFTLLSKRRDFKTGIFAVVSLALAISTKQEGIILMPLFLVFVFLFFDFKFLKKIHKSRKFWYLVILFAVLIIPHILHLSVELYPTLLYGEKTGLAPRGILTLENIGDNFQVLSRFASTFYPWVFNLLIVIGVLYSIKKFRKQVVFLLLFFILFLSVYLTYGYMTHEIYMVVVYAPLIILGGVGIFYLEDVLSGLISKGAKKKEYVKYISFAVSCVLAVIMLLSFSPFFYKLYDVNPLGSASGYTRDHIFYQESLYIESISEELGNSYVVTELPMVFAGTSVKPFQTSNFLSYYKDADPEEIFDRIYYFEDLFCTDFYSYGNRCGLENESFETCEVFRKEKVSKCEEMHKTYELIPFLEYTFNLSENTRIQHGATTNIASFHVYIIKGRKSF